MEEKSFRSLLIQAAKEGNSETVETLYQKFAKLDSKKDEFYYGLYFAAFNGKENVVKLLLSKGVNPNTIIGSYLTPLHAAALNGHEVIVKMLLNYGANVNPKIKTTSGKKVVNTEYFCSPLLGAVYNNKEVIADLLLQRGAKVNVKFNPAKDNFGKDDVEKQLTIGTFSTYRVSSSEENNIGFSPLHFAINRNNPELVSLLLANGANINAKCNYDLTPLCIACKNNDIPLIKLLIKEGADINLQVEKGKTLLYYALFKSFESTFGEEYDWYDKEEEIERNATFRFLLNCGLDPNGKSKKDETVLHLAANSGLVNAVHLLLKHDANVNALDSNNKTPFELAVNSLQELLSDIQSSYCDPSDSSDDDDYYERNDYLDSSEEEERDRERDERRNERTQRRENRYKNRKIYNLTHTRYAYMIHHYKRTKEHDEGFSVCDDPDPFRAICQLLTRELVRLEAIGKKNVKQNVALLETPFVKPYYTRCKNELKKLKKNKIVEGVSYYDFFIATDSKLKEYMKNKKIAEAMESQEWKKLFPNFMRYLRINMERGLTRKRSAEERESEGSSDEEEVKKSVQMKGTAKRRRVSYGRECVVS